MPQVRLETLPQKLALLQHTNAHVVYLLNLWKPYSHATSQGQCLDDRSPFKKKRTDCRLLAQDFPVNRVNLPYVLNAVRLATWINHFIFTQTCFKIIA